MATTKSYMEDICERLKDMGEVRFRAMFGEYLLYINDKPVFLICDDTVFIKKQLPLQKLMESSRLGYPYVGAKEHYILDICDSKHVYKVIQLLLHITPLPKSKRASKD